MNIQDRERDVLKKNLPSALGKIHLLKQPCQDNTELNISLSMLNTFMIQTGKQHRKPISLPPAPRLVLRSQMRAAGSTPGLCSTSLRLGSPHVGRGSKKGPHLPPESLTAAFQDRKRNKPKISLPGGANRGHCEHAARGDKGTHTPNTLGVWITWGSTRKGWMQTFGATLFGRRRAPRETHPAKTSFLPVPSKHACRLQVGERGQAATRALGLKASIPEQLSAARDAQHSPCTAPTA